MHGGLLYKFSFLNTLSLILIYLLTMVTHAAGLSKLLGNIRSPEVVHNAEDEDYFVGRGMGVTTMGQHKMEISEGWGGGYRTSLGESVLTSCGVLIPSGLCCYCEEL